VKHAIDSTCGLTGTTTASAHHADLGAGETVNCNGGTESENDIHMALGAAADTEECSSVSAEISPPYRPAPWNEIGHYERYNKARRSMSLIRQWRRGFRHILIASRVNCSSMRRTKHVPAGPRARRCARRSGRSIPCTRSKSAIRRVMRRKQR
jgi:hypothetical protein